jgi:hypothetical protein
LCATEKALPDDKREDELERAKMANERTVLEFVPPALFEWDEQKSELNQAKHGIDFEDAVEVFYAPVILRQSNRNNEERWIALGYLDNS